MENGTSSNVVKDSLVWAFWEFTWRFGFAKIDNNKFLASLDLLYSLIIIDSWNTNDREFHLCFGFHLCFYELAKFSLWSNFDLYSLNDKV